MKVGCFKIIRSAHLVCFTSNVGCDWQYLDVVTSKSVWKELKKDPSDHRSKISHRRVARTRATRISCLTSSLRDPNLYFNYICKIANVPRFHVTVPLLTT